MLRICLGSVATCCYIGFLPGNLSYELCWGHVPTFSLAFNVINLCFFAFCMSESMCLQFVVNHIFALSVKCKICVRFSVFNM